MLGLFLLPNVWHDISIKQAKEGKGQTETISNWQFVSETCCVANFIACFVKEEMWKMSASPA
jgi:hypothetical protein